jgi:hypothetical protein
MGICEIEREGKKDGKIERTDRDQEEKRKREEGRRKIKREEVAGKGERKRREKKGSTYRERQNESFFLAFLVLGMAAGPLAPCAHTPATELCPPIVSRLGQEDNCSVSTAIPGASSITGSFRGANWPMPAHLHTFVCLLSVLC